MNDKKDLVTGKIRRKSILDGEYISVKVLGYIFFFYEIYFFFTRFLMYLCFFFRLGRNKYLRLGCSFYLYLYF